MIRKSKSSELINYKMLPIIDQFVVDLDPSLVMFINTIITLHLLALAGYAILLTRDLFRGTDSAYPYKKTEAMVRKTQ